MLWIKRFWQEEEGAEITEYALLAVILAVAVLAGGPVLQTALEGAFTALSGAVTTQAGGL